MALYPDYIENIETGVTSNGQQALLDSLVEEGLPPLEVPFDISQVKEMGIKNPLGMLMQLIRQYAPKLTKQTGKLYKKSLKDLKKDDLIDMIIPSKKGFKQRTKDYFKGIPKRTLGMFDPRVHPIRKAMKAGGLGYQQFGTEEGITSPYSLLPIPGLPGIGATPLSSITGFANMISDIAGTKAGETVIGGTVDAINAVSKGVGAGDILPSSEEINTVKSILEARGQDTTQRDTTKQEFLIDKEYVKNMVDSLMNERDYQNPKLNQLLKDSSVYKYMEEEWGF